MLEGAGGGLVPQAPDLGAFACDAVFSGSGFP